jgi:hypothetical protein
VSEFEFQKSTPPRFTLPGHEWMPIQWQNFDRDGEIRIKGEWRLVRKIKFVPSAEQAKQNLKRPAKERVKPVVKPLPWRLSKIAVDAASVSDVMRNLADLVKRGLAEKQSAKDRTNKLPKILRKKPGATMNEIRDAAGLLHYLVSLGCNSLMEIAKKNPEIVQPLARKEVSWPLMMSRHPGYSVKHIKFLESLKQGEDAYYDIHQTSRNGTQRMAVEKGTRKIAEKLYLCLLVEWEQTQEKLDGKQVAGFCDDKKIYSAWWKVAESRLLEAYPQPCEIPELARIAAPSRRFPSDKNADIRRRLKTAFLGLAKNQDELAKLANDPAV